MTPCCMGRFSEKKYEAGRRVNAIRMDVSCRQYNNNKKKKNARVGRVSAGHRKRQDRHPVDSRMLVIDKVSAGPIAMQETLLVLQYLIETFLQYNDVANQRKKHLQQF